MDNVPSREYKGFGPTLLAVAATNEPHLQLKGYEVTIVEINGEKYIRVPALIKGAFDYLGETLIFDDAFFETLLRNHNNEVWESAPYFRVGHARTPALGWFDKESGGFFQIEDNLFVGYAKPVDEEAIKEIESKKYRYASSDIVLDYVPNALALFSVPMKEMASRLRLDRSEQMKNKKEEQKPEEEVILEDASVEEAQHEEKEEKPTLDAIVADLQNTVKAMQQDLMAALEKLNKPEPKAEPEVDQKDEVDLEDKKDDATVSLQRQVAELESKLFGSRLGAVLFSLENKRDENGNGYPQAVTQFVSDVFSKREFSSAGNVVKLEAKTDRAVDEYYLDAIATLLLEVVTPSVSMAQKTEVTDDNPLDDNGEQNAIKQTIEVYKRFWSGTKIDM